MLTHAIQEEVESGRRLRRPSNPKSFSGGHRAEDFTWGFETCTTRTFVANSGCTPNSAACRYSVRIWKARICLGLGFIGQIFKRLHFAVQTWPSVMQLVRVSVVLICAVVPSTELKLVCAEVGTPPRILQTPWSTRQQTFQSIRFSVSGGCDCWISTSKRSKQRRRTEVSAPPAQPIRDTRGRNPGFRLLLLCKL